MHEEKFNVLGVVNEEGLVARGHHVAGLLVAPVADLNINPIIISNPYIPPNPNHEAFLSQTYRRHRDVALEASTDAVVDTLGFAP